MALSFSFAELHFSGCERVVASEGALVVLVGPNNSGKSRALRDLFALAKDPQSPRVVVRDATMRKAGTSEEFYVRFSHYLKRKDRMIEAGGNSWHIVDTDMGLKPDHPLGPLAALFCNVATAEQRLQAANPAHTLDFLIDSPSHALQVLYRRDNIEKRLSSYFRQAFGLDLIINRGSGKSIPLHCGTTPVLGPGEDRVSESYLGRLAEVPLLHQQGDGMRSFVGSLLHVAVGESFVVLLDEPEAFLHPPQARLLGTLLAREKPSNRQLFVATHSGDVLRGLLDAESSSVMIVRLQRVGDVNHARVLSPADLRELWVDPMLRYSNILDGMFHEHVLLCDADADCRFYAAVMDAVLDGQTDVQRPDIMFTPCGGKHHTPALARALVSLGVPVGVVADFDVLNAEEPLHSIVTALKGDWNVVKDDWRRVHRAVEAKGPPLSKLQVRECVVEIFDRISGTMMTREADEEIRTALKSVSQWGVLKGIGISGIPAGEATVAVRRLLEQLRQIGLFVVEGGELEGFARSVGGHGPGWVRKVLEREIKADVELESARAFMRQVLTQFARVRL